MASTNGLSVGQRIAWHRKRRGLSQEALAGLVGRTGDWLSKIENDRATLDRLSVIRCLASALGIKLADLLEDLPSHKEVGGDNREMSILRTAITDYRRLSSIENLAERSEPSTLPQLKRELSELWKIYQSSRYNVVIQSLPGLLADTHRAERIDSGDKATLRLLGHVYHLAATMLTKVDEKDLAWISAERGLMFARASEDKIAIISLLRSVTHALSSSGRHEAATKLTMDVSTSLAKKLTSAGPELLSVYGTLFLAGAMAASRTGDRNVTRLFLTEAQGTARRLGDDANYVWTAFGPTNVAIHQVATAIELGDVQLAVDLGPRLTTSTLPVERRARHGLAVAHALGLWNRTDEALATLLDIERFAPEMVRHHHLSREMTLSWMQRQKGRPSFQLVDLARRLRIL